MRLVLLDFENRILRTTVIKATAHTICDHLRGSGVWGGSENVQRRAGAGKEFD